MNSRFQLRRIDRQVQVLLAAAVLLGVALVLAAVGFLLPALLPLAGAAALAGYWVLRMRPETGAASSLPFPGTARVATGGVWEVVDPHHLIAEPGTRHVMRVSFTPDSTFIASSIRAVMRATEAWWDERPGYAGEQGRERIRRVGQLAELPSHLDGPLSFEAGKTETWDLVFNLDDDAPSSGGDPEFVSCEWAVEFTVARRLRFDAVFVQPVFVAQPSARLNAGAIEESELSRAAESTASSGSISITFAAHPTPLDLAAPARIELSIRNGGVPVSGNGVRLEVYVRGRSYTGESREWIVWSETRHLSPLPLGVTQLRYEMPAINEPIPDMDLQHGWYRGALRFIVDIPYGPDIVVGRDLSLSFDKPAVPPVPATPQARGAAPKPAVRVATVGVDRPGTTDEEADAEAETEPEP
jgi:hypothetical protein